ncbi:MAG TPA: hypothetical protein VMR25_25545 [Planctomycetaceae bacterium]|nr:hypothetical protein [Planctomycetaceae bacterium]
MNQQHDETSGKMSSEESRDSIPPSVTRRKWNWLAFLSFLLAVFLMVLPGEADALWMPLRAGHFVEAACIAAVCSAVVLVPFVLGRRCRRQSPDRWTGRGYLITTGIILILNTVWVTCVFGYQLLRRR